MKSTNLIVWLVTDDPESSKCFGLSLEKQGLITTVLNKASDAVLRLERVKPSLIIVDLYKDGDLAHGIASLLRQTGFGGKIAFVVPTANFAIRLTATKLLISAVESRPTSPVLMVSLAQLGTNDQQKSAAPAQGFLARLFSIAA